MYFVFFTSLAFKNIYHSTAICIIFAIALSYKWTFLLLLVISKPPWKCPFFTRFVPNSLLQQMKIMGNQNSCAFKAPDPTHTKVWGKLNEMRPRLVHFSRQWAIVKYIHYAVAWDICLKQEVNWIVLLITRILLSGILVWGHGKTLLGSKGGDSFPGFRSYSGMILANWSQLFLDQLDP